MTDEEQRVRMMLPTSRSAPAQERGVLGILRAIAPRRRLTNQEACRVAELQANRLLALAGNPQVPIPNELLIELPRLAVTYDADLPTSGMVQWNNGRWLVALNSSEPATRMRFSLAHEVKHVIDHRHVDELYATATQAEAAADYFAACLWMPKVEVRRAWYAGRQSITALATHFAVSPQAMARRLDDLGLRRREARRPSAPDETARAPRRYYRSASAAGVVI